MLAKTGFGYRKSFRVACLVLGIVAVGLIVRLPKAVRAGSEADDAVTARQEYNEKIAAKYNFRYGKEFPFLPSNATTDTGAFIDAQPFRAEAYLERTPLMHEIRRDGLTL